MVRQAERHHPLPTSQSSLSATHTGLWGGGGGRHYLHSHPPVEPVPVHRNRSIFPSAVAGRGEACAATPPSRLQVLC